MRKSLILAAVVAAATVTGCDKKPPSATVERLADGESVSLTGQIRAKDEVSLAFRIDGRVIERPVNVGDVLKPGQLVARLDPKDQENALRTAEANLSAP